jgi:hypothetical protein
MLVVNFGVIVTVVMLAVFASVGAVLPTARVAPVETVTGPVMMLL